MVLLCCQSLFSASAAEVPPALPKEAAKQFGELYVLYNGRVAPLSTMALDYTLKAYGKDSKFGYNPVQVVTGWLFYYDWWRDVPFRGKLSEDDARDMLMEVSSGRAFRIFPLNFDADLQATNPGLPERLWLGPDDALPVGLDYQQWVYVRRTLDLISDLVKDNDWDAVEEVLTKVAKWQVETASEDIPSKSKVRAENLYNCIGLPKVPFMLALTIGLLLFVLACVLISKGRKYPSWVRACSCGFALLLFVYLSLVIGLRWYVGGRGPYDGGYAVMMLIAWFASLGMFCLGRKIEILYPLGFLVAGFTMLEACIGGADYIINPLLPALKSPFLSVHVMCMMFSYTLFGIVMLNAIMGLGVKGSEAKERLAFFGYKVLLPAEGFLIVGTILGSIWAKQAWGSFWSWDPKETWALITAIVYAAVIVLRRTALKGKGGTLLFNILCIVSFICVLLTYFGVNLIFGGMHSYV